MLEKVAGFDWLPIAQETKRLRESFSSSHERGKKKNKSKGIERLRNPHSDALPVSHREVDGKMGCY